mgnify:CR=1 FL=1
MLQFLLIVCSQISGESLIIDRPPLRMEVRGDQLKKDRTIELALSSQLHITISMPAPAEVDFPKIVNSPDWIVRTQKWETVGKAKIGRFILEPTRPFQEKRYLQILPIGYLPGGKSEWRDIDWPPIEVRVTTSVSDVHPSSIRDRLPLEELPKQQSIPWLMIAIVAVGVIVLSLVGHQLWRRWHRETPLTASERAIQSLESISLADPSRACAEISQVMRRYLDARFSIPASTRTTPDLLRALRDHETFPSSEVERLSDLLRSCDLGSFTGLPVEEDVIQELMTRTKSLVGDLESWIDSTISDQHGARIDGK